MKREAVSHTKMKRLCRRLDIPTWQAVGLLESIWLLTAREAPRGDIGKLSDEDIAIGIDYRGNEQPMIEALVHCGWLDRSDAFRLVVHDWADHADDSVHMKVARTKQYFVRTDGGFVRPRLSRLAEQERRLITEWYTGDELAMCAHNETLCAQNRDPCTLSGHAVRTACAQNDDLCRGPALPRLSPALPVPAARQGPADTQRACAPDPPPSRFEEFWARWPRKTGKDSAVRSWLSYVTPQTEAAAFACLERFLRSGDVARGAIPNLGAANNKPGWLADCARDGFECDWPPVVNGNGKPAQRESREEMLDRALSVSFGGKNAVK